jgi:hypothetical protein
MRKPSTYLILSLTLMTAACGNKKDVDPFPKSTVPNTSVSSKNATQTTPDAKPYENPIHNLSYEITNEGESGTFCTTGLKKFKTEHDLCMHLIDHDFNHNCGNQKRYETFLRECGPKGYLPFDGLQCKIGILKDEITDTVQNQPADRCYEQFEKSDFIASKEGCTGRTVGLKDDEVYYPVNQSYSLTKDLQLTINSAYVLPNQITGINFTHLDAHYATDKERYDIQFRAGLTMAVGCVDETLKSSDHTYHLYMACKPVPGCR